MSKQPKAPSGAVQVINPATDRLLGNGTVERLVPGPEGLVYEVQPGRWIDPVKAASIGAAGEVQPSSAEKAKEVERG